MYDTFTSLITAAGLPESVPEYRFHPTRRWRFDLAWPDEMLALEIEGGVWTAGRHVRSQGYLGDMEKYNAAMLLGWRVLRVSTRMVADGRALALLLEAFSGKKSSAWRQYVSNAPIEDHEGVT